MTQLTPYMLPARPWSTGGSGRFHFDPADGVEPDDTSADAADLGLDLSAQLYGLDQQDAAAPYLVSSNFGDWPCECLSAALRLARADARETGVEVIVCRRDGRRGRWHVVERVTVGRGGA